MSEVNPDNERIKRRYFHHLKEAEGLAPVTIDHVARSIAGFEKFVDWADFGQFTAKTAIAYRNSLLAGNGKRAAQLSSRSTIHTKLMHLEKFYRWLAGQPGFKTRINFVDVECFGLSRRDRKLALQPRDQPTPSLEHVQTAIRNMPATTDVELRNRAVMACLLLTGARVSALASLKLKHVDSRGIEFDAREVHTKGGKSFPTFFCPVGEDIRDFFRAYVDHLRSELGFGDMDPLFPCTKQAVGEAHMFEIAGLQRTHWKTADPIRSICRAAFHSAGLPAYSPQSIRRTLVRLGQRLCHTPEQFKAWSQNIGHNEVLTSLTSYGAVPRLRQAELIRELGPHGEPGSDLEELQRLLNSPSIKALVNIPRAR